QNLQSPFLLHKQIFLEYFPGKMLGFVFLISFSPLLIK
ncbi:hypothetical protein NT05LI_3463a, partial [Listeria ivanovii FSL F6-596]